MVTAAPPSYTRMYHYFPAHLTTHPFCFYPQPPPPQIAPPTMTQLPAPPTLKQLGNSLSSMTQAHIAQTLRYPGKSETERDVYYKFINQKTLRIFILKSNKRYKLKNTNIFYTITNYYFNATKY